MGLVYFGISSLLISLLTIRLLEDRGIGLGQLEEISILVLVSLGIIYNICLIPIHGPDSLLYICRLVFIFPFLISISIVDAATRWVYDIDILGGILVSELIFSLRILENLLDNINNVDKIGPLLYNNIIGLILLFGLSYGLYRVTRGIGMGCSNIYHGWNHGRFDRLLNGIFHVLYKCGPILYSDYDNE